jgi:nucleoside 2-deoxyribosyltransferase
MLVYLASPYSHPDPDKLEERFQEVCVKAGELMMEGFEVFCPIAHSHPVDIYHKNLPRTHEFWLKQDYAILQHCKVLFVYMMEGWEKSYGVGAEIEFAKKHGIPVKYLHKTEAEVHDKAA